MKNFYVFINLFLTAIVAVVIFQIIPTFISSNDWTKVGIGFGLVLLSLVFIWARVVEIYNDLFKGKE